MWIFLMLATLYEGIASQGNQCPVFGTDLTAPLPSSPYSEELRGLYANFEDPSQCTGNVIAWRFCLYVPNITSGLEITEFSAALRIYRQNKEVANTYNVIPESSKPIMMTFTQSQSNSFQCFEEIIPPSQQFKIHENDIVGACLPVNGSGRLPLDLVGSNITRRDELLYQYDTNDYGECENMRINTIRTTDTNFIQRMHHRLHLHADTDAPTAACKIGDNRPATLGRLNIGGRVFLNTLSPATCNGTVTKFKYCYYSTPTLPNQTHSMSIGIWTFRENSYHLIFIKSITMNPVETLARIYCLEEELNSTDYVNVTTNDVIGVAFPTNYSIPVIGRDPFNNSYLMRSFISEKEKPNLELRSNRVLHIQATIETTIDVTTTATEASSKASRAIIRVALSTVMSVVLCVSATSVIIIFICLRQRYKAKRRLPLGMGIDNLGYNLSTPEKIEVVEYVCAQNDNNVSPCDEIGLYSSLRALEYEEPLKLKTGPARIEAITSTSQRYQEVAYAPPVDNIQLYEEQLQQIQKGVKCDYEEIYEEPGNNEDAIYTSLRKRNYLNIPTAAIVIGDEIGSGQYGQVKQGFWQKSPTKVLNIAVKMLQKNSTKLERLRFFQEAAVMAQFKHQNVISLYGVTEKNGITMIVVELLQKGDLQKYLSSLQPQRIQSSISRPLLSFSKQICLGMNYLSSKKFVHRDLAARNILLSGDYMCKIADFGLSRKLEDDNYYKSKGGLIPLKWTAPEAVEYNKYSTASDVWSYGCVLYEIWSLGHKPFEEKKNDEILKILHKGIRLAPPPGCPRQLYQIMIQSWAMEPNKRPSFRDMLLSLLEDETTVLRISVEKQNCSTQAGILGAPLQAGYSMYTDLQRTYIK